jgi:hypothetical protein
MQQAQFYLTAAVKKKWDDEVNKVLQKTVDKLLHNDWQQTPKWHPRYWFGHRWRRPTYDDNTYTGVDLRWEYQTHKQRARQSLEEHYGQEEAGQPLTIFS